MKKTRKITPCKVAKATLVCIALFVFPALLATGHMFVLHDFPQKTVLIGIGTLYAYTAFRVVREASRTEILYPSYCTFTFTVFPLSEIHSVFFVHDIRFEHYDILLHFLGGSFIAILFYAALQEIGVSGNDFCIVKTVSLVFLVGIAWELYEWYAHIIGAPLDTVEDIVCDIAGGLFVCILNRR